MGPEPEEMAYDVDMRTFAVNRLPKRGKFGAFERRLADMMADRVDGPPVIPTAAEKMAEEVAQTVKRKAAGKKAAIARTAVASEVVCGGKRYQFSASGKCVGVAE